MDCLFCKIVAGQIPAKKVHEDGHCLGFFDLHPQAPTHALFIPKRHLSTVNDATAADRELLGHLTVAAASYAKGAGLAEDGYRLVMNCNSNGGQTVFHIHLHLLAGRRFTWPPG
jgi:histidine triad (HIT) family protein